MWFKSPDPSSEIFVDSVTVECVNMFKFLGVRLDKDMKFGHHRDYLLAKLNSSFHIMRRYFQMLPPNAVVGLFNAIALPHLNYCSSAIQPYLTRGDVLRIQMILKKIVKILPINHLDYVEICNRNQHRFLIKLINHGTPSRLAQLLVPTSHQYSTRRCRFERYRPKRKIGFSCFSYWAPRLANI